MSNATKFRPKKLFLLFVYMVASTALLKLVLYHNSCITAKNLLINEVEDEM